MNNLPHLVPDVEVLLAFEPEELGGVILSMYRDQPAALLAPGVIVSQAWPTASFGDGEYPSNRRDEVEIAVAEAFAWLQSEGLLVRAPGPNGSNGYSLQSRRARKLRTDAHFSDYAAAKLLPRSLLHSRIRDSAWLAFVRGSYPTAVFEAMREVEIAVREAAGYPQGDHGVPMVRRAFNKDSGPLTDQNAEEAEKEALSALFAGAIGSYKNPHSHRRVPLDDPAEAAEIVMLASHLLRIVEARGSGAAATRSV